MSFSGAIATGKSRVLQLIRWNPYPVPRPFKQLGLSALATFGKSSSQPYEFLRRAVQGQPLFWSGAEAFSHEANLPCCRRACAAVSRAPVRGR